MTNRKAIRRARRIRRTVLTVCLMALVAVISIGGTIAWLTAKSGPVTNTFTTSTIGVTLTEPAGVEPNYQFKMVPGQDITKNPQITVAAKSEASYVFIKVTKSDNYDDFLNAYAQTSEWTKLSDDKDNNDLTDVYYKTMDAQGETASAAVKFLAGDKVTVKDTVKESDLKALTSANYPTLKFEAFAIQQAGMNDAADAWDKLVAQGAY